MGVRKCLLENTLIQEEKKPWKSSFLELEKTPHKLVFVLFVAHCTGFKYMAYIMKQGAEKNSSDFSRPRFWRHCNLLKGSWYLIVNIKIFPYDENMSRNGENR